VFVQPRKQFTDPLAPRGYKETPGQAHGAHDFSSSVVLHQTYGTDFSLTQHVLVTLSLPSRFERASPHLTPLA
jgi:hypothetical protein